MDSIRRIIACVFLAGFAGAAVADEGMWMPSQIPALTDKLAALGFTGDAKEFADLTGQPMWACRPTG